MTENQLAEPLPLEQPSSHSLDIAPQQGPSVLPLSPSHPSHKAHVGTSVPWHEAQQVGQAPAWGGAVLAQGLTRSPGSQRHVHLSACLSPGRCQQGAGLLPTAPRGSSPGPGPAQESPRL